MFWSAGNDCSHNNNATGSKCQEENCLSDWPGLIPRGWCQDLGPVSASCRTPGGSIRGLAEQFSAAKLSGGGVIGPFVSDKSLRGWEFNSLCRRQGQRGSRSLNKTKLIRFHVLFSCKHPPPPPAPTAADLPNEAAAPTSESLANYLAMVRDALALLNVCHKRGAGTRRGRGGGGGGNGGWGGLTMLNVSIRAAVEHAFHSPGP